MFDHVIAILRRTATRWSTPCFVVSEVRSEVTCNYLRLRFSTWICRLHLLVITPVRDCFVNTELIGGMYCAKKELCSFGFHVEVYRRLVSLNTGCPLTAKFSIVSFAVRFQVPSGLYASVPYHFCTPWTRECSMTHGKLRDILTHFCWILTQIVTLSFFVVNVVVHWHTFNSSLGILLLSPELRVHRLDLLEHLAVNVLILSCSNILADSR